MENGLPRCAACVHSYRPVALCCLRRAQLEGTCPFSFYRVSVDVAPQFFSTVHNVNRALPYLRPSAPLSRPGCWAYPDSKTAVSISSLAALSQSITRAVLEVGVAPMTFTESQTHFAMWCVTSAPLILGFE